MMKTFRIGILRFRSDNRKSKIENLKWPGLSVVAFVLVMAVAAAEAQQPTKVHRIGYLTGASLSANSARHEAFRQGLRDLGYVEGKNIVIAAKQATTTIPVVMAQDGDPVGSGFIASLARPGGNITGLSALAPELNGKRLELLREIVPKLSRVAVLGTSTQAGHGQSLKEVELAATSSGVKLQYLDVLRSKEITTAFRAATKGRAEAVLMLLAGRVASSHRGQIAELAVESQLPAIYDRSEFAEHGGLMTYGVNLSDLDRRAATYVDKIVKGAKPTDIPVEQPKKFDLVINLKAAEQIGLTIPSNVLARADKVIR